MEDEAGKAVVFVLLQDIPHDLLGLGPVQVQGDGNDDVQVVESFHGDTSVSKQISDSIITKNSLLVYGYAKKIYILR